MDTSEAVATGEWLSIELPLGTEVRVATLLMDDCADSLELAEVVAELVAEGVVVLDPEADEVSKLVPLIVDSVEGVGTEEGVWTELPLGNDVPVATPLIVDALEAVAVDEKLLEVVPETVPLIDASLELVAVAEGLGDALAEGLLTEVIDGTEDSVAVPLMVDTPEPEEVADKLPEAVAEADELPETLGLLDSILEAVALLTPVLEELPEADEVPHPLPLTDELTEALALLVPVDKVLPDTVAVAELLPLPVATPEPLALPRADSEPVKDGTPELENKPEGEGAGVKVQGLLADSNGLAEAETLADPDSPALAEPDPELETLPLNSPLTLPDAENQADGEWLNEFLLLAERLLVPLTDELETPELLKLRTELRDTEAAAESLAAPLEDRVPTTERVSDTLTVVLTEGRTEPLELTVFSFDTDTEADTDPDWDELADSDLEAQPLWLALTLTVELLLAELLSDPDKLGSPDDEGAFVSVTESEPDPETVRVGPQVILGVPVNTKVEVLDRLL